MHKEDKIIGMFEQIMGKLDEHDSLLKEHGQILSALRSGQEYLKAEIDGMKLSNATEFEALKERTDGFTANIEVLRDETWKNKTDIHRRTKAEAAV